MKGKMNLGEILAGIQSENKGKQDISSLIEALKGVEQPKVLLSDIVKALTEPHKHKVFVSYHHDSDEYYRNEFERLFGGIFVNKSVGLNEIDSDISTEYIKRLIQEEYITDSSVIVVLIGENSWRRKHIDWEISAALNKKVGGHSGILGICLPTHPDYGHTTYDSTLTPGRLVDNIESGFAHYINWTGNIESMKARIQDAFDARTQKKDLIKNDRIQMIRNQ